MGNSLSESYGDSDFFNGYDLTKLKRDQCYLTIVNKHNESIYLYSKYEECYKCSYTYQDIIEKETNKTLIVDTTFSKQYKLMQNTSEPLFEPSEFGSDYSEFGIYQAQFETESDNFLTLKQPVDIYLPILTVFLIYLLLFLLILLGKFLWKQLRFQRLDLPFVSKPKSPKSTRVQSLDTFRGISIVLMIFVNYGHGGYAFLEHAVWNGLYVGDMVFPSFLWIMGVCIPISLKSHFNKEDAKNSVAIWNVTKRSIKLFALGLFLGASPYFETMRIFGVLQRFAISYFVVAVFLILTPNIVNKRVDTQISSLRFIINLWRPALQWGLMLLIVAAHCLLTFCLEVPNCPTGYLGPGGLHNNGKYEGCTGGAAGYIDDVVLGRHIYQKALITSIYQSTPLDPEGILGCLTTIFQVFIGVQAGYIIVKYKNHKERLLGWIILGFLCGIIGGALCNFSKEEGVIPVNKHLWSLSFVLVTSCFAFILLSLCYIAIDVFKIWTGKPFLFAGMNAILMYVGHNMTYGNYFPIHWYVSMEKADATHFMMLLENVWATSFWVLVAYYLMKIKFFWTL